MKNYIERVRKPYEKKGRESCKGVNLSKGGKTFVLAPFKEEEKKCFRAGETPVQPPFLGGGGGMCQGGEKRRGKVGGGGCVWGGFD